jgi:hypothetical protein
VKKAISRPTHRCVGSLNIQRLAASDGDQVIKKAAVKINRLVMTDASRGVFEDRRMMRGSIERIHSMQYEVLF